MSFTTVLALVAAVIAGMVLESIQGGVTKMVTWVWRKMVGK